MRPHYPMYWPIDVFKIPEILDFHDRNLAKMERTIRAGRAALEAARRQHRYWNYILLATGQVLWIDSGRATVSYSADYQPPDPRDCSSDVEFCVIAVPTTATFRAEYKVTDTAAQTTQETGKPQATKDLQRDTLIDLQAAVYALYDQTERLRNYAQAEWGDEPHALFDFSGPSSTKHWVQDGAALRYIDSAVKIVPFESVRITRSAPRKQFDVPEGPLRIVVLHGTKVLDLRDTRRPRNRMRQENRLK